MSIKFTATTDTLSLTTSLPNKYPITHMIWIFIPTGYSSATVGYFGVRSDSSDDTWAGNLRSGAAPHTTGEYSSGGGDHIGAATVTENAWHNFAISISSGGAINSYIDGVVDITGVTASSAITATTFQVGHSVDGNNAPFDGTLGVSIYSLKVYNAELSQSQIVTEIGCDTPILTTNLYDCWLLNTVGTAGTANNNSHTFTTVTGFAAGQANPSFSGCGGGAVAEGGGTTIIRLPRRYWG